MQHTIIKTATGYQCTVCNWTWKSKPQSYCPGVPRYEWKTAPASLKTKGQLAKAGLKPAASRRAVVLSGRLDEYDLFDETEAVPFTAEEIAIQKEFKRKARYRTCRICHQEVRREKWDPEHKVCDKCLPGLLERIYAMQEAEEAAYAEKLSRMWAKDRNESIQWARAFLADPDALILDTETTGLEWSDEIVQIAVINPAGDVLLNNLVNPGRPIPAEVTGLHGITDEMVKDAPTWKEVYAQLQKIALGKNLASYNSEFDLSMIYQSGKKFAGLFGVLTDFRAESFACVMKLYAAFYGEWSKHHGSYRWQPLPSGDHSALGDCLAALEVIKKMASAKLSSEEELK